MGIKNDPLGGGLGASANQDIAAQAQQQAGQNVGPGGSQRQIAEEEERLRKEASDKWGENTTNESALAGFRQQGAGTAYNPGSEEVGGRGMAQEYHDAAMGRMHEGDAAYAANQAAMGNSLREMQGNRGQTSPENDALLRRESNSRGQQALGLDMQRQAAMGGAPSAASYQTQMAMDGNMAGQAAASGSARGLAGLNGVQGAGAAQAGTAGGGIAMTGGMGRSKEMQEAMGMYGSNAGMMRQGDITRLRDSGANSLANADLNNQWKLGNAGLAAKQGQLGVEQDKMAGNWYDAASEPAKKQAEYDQIMQGMQHGQSAAEASAAVAANRAAQDRNRQIGGTAAQVGLTAIGSLAGPAGTMGGGMLGSMVNNYITGGGKK